MFIGLVLASYFESLPLDLYGSERNNLVPDYVNLAAAASMAFTTTRTSCTLTEGFSAVCSNPCLRYIKDHLMLVSN